MSILDQPLTPERDRAVRALLKHADARQAQLLLAALVWPGEVPDPRVVDAYVRAHSPLSSTMSATAAAGRAAGQRRWERAGSTG